MLMSISTVSATKINNLLYVTVPTPNASLPDLVAEQLLKVQEILLDTVEYVESVQVAETPLSTKKEPVSVYCQMILSSES